MRLLLTNKYDVVARRYTHKGSTLVLGASGHKSASRPSASGTPLLPYAPWHLTSHTYFAFDSDGCTASGCTGTTVGALCGTVTNSGGAADNQALQASGLGGGGAAEGGCCYSGTGYEQPTASAYASVAADAARNYAEHTGEGADPHSTRALLQSSDTAITIPSSVSSGTASALFPNASFASWCTSDAACAAAVSSGSTFSLSLTHITNTAPITSVTLNWPNVFPADGVSSLTLVSGVVELQLYDSTGSYTAKQDQAICSSSGTSTATGACSAQLVMPLRSAMDATKSFVCLRLEPTILGAWTLDGGWFSQLQSHQLRARACCNGSLVVPGGVRDVITAVGPWRCINPLVLLQSQHVCFRVQAVAGKAPGSHTAEIRARAAPSGVHAKACKP